MNREGGEKDWTWEETEGLCLTLGPGRSMMKEHGIEKFYVTPFSNIFRGCATGGGSLVERMRDSLSQSEFAGPDDLVSVFFFGG